MNLQNIETVVLRNIGADYYADISTSSDSGKMADFAMLHRCVNLAREEIRKFCHIPALMEYTANIVTVASTNEYTIPETDFDVPKKVFSISSSGLIIGELKKINEQNFLQKMGNEDIPEDPPSFYEMIGSTSAGLSKIRLYPTPKRGGDYIIIKYLKLLTDLTSATDEDILLKKYSLEIITLATAFAFQMLKKDDKNFDKWLIIGRGYFKNINFYESGFDNDTEIATDELLVKMRQGRRTI